MNHVMSIYRVNFVYQEGTVNRLFQFFGNCVQICTVNMREHSPIWALNNEIFFSQTDKQIYCHVINVANKAPGGGGRDLDKSIRRL